MFLGNSGRKLESQGVPLCQAFSTPPPYFTEQCWSNSDVAFQNKSQIRVQNHVFGEFWAQS